VKPTRHVGLLLLVIVFIIPFFSGQESSPPLGDLARQEREHKQSQAGNSGQDETSGLSEGSFKANILITDSHAAIEKWVLMPAAEKASAGRIRQLIRDKKFYLPFVVTEYDWPAPERMNLTAHVRLLSPEGRVLLDNPTFSRTIGADPRSPHVIVLNPVMDITFDSTDQPGTYTIRVTVTDHVHSAYAKAEERFELVGKAGTETKKITTDPNGPQ